MTKEQTVLARDFNFYLTPRLDKLDQIMTKEQTVLARDFNFYLTPRLDKLDQINESQDNRNNRSDIQSFMEVNNLLTFGQQ